jgi:hypothetical protein
VCEFFCNVLAYCIVGPNIYLPLSNDIVDSLGDAIGVIIKAQVTKQHSAGEEQSGWVRLVLAPDIQSDVTAARLEYRDITAHVASWNNTWTSNKCCTDVGKDTSVQVGHNHNVELLGPRYCLHGSVVNNHVVSLESRVLLGDFLEGVSEQTIGQLHDVGLVDASNLLAVVRQSKTKGEFRDALRFGLGDDL